jgi:4-amino-4-deoxy-L-arabinose transferase-like glycosyltransferase
MEFPVMQWLYAVCYKTFGDNIAITRILSFILGLLSTWGMFYLIDRLFNDKALATIGAWAFTFSPLFYYYSLNPLPDNFALCCGIWSIGVFFHYLKTSKNSSITFSGSMLSLAALAKLPFIIYGAVAFTGIIMAWRKGNIKDGFKIAVVYALILLPVVAWYITAIPTWGENGVLKGMLDHKLDAYPPMEILLHNLTSTLPELLLNYGSVPFFIAGFYFLFRNKGTEETHFPLLLVWALAVAAYFLFEMNMIGKVHDYYLMPFLPLLFIIVAYGAYQLLKRKAPWLKIVSIIILLLLPLPAFLRIDGRWNTESPGFNPVYYSHKNELRAIVPENEYVVAGNDESHFILLYYLNRKGWAFDNDRIDGGTLANYISKGAKYLFIDSRLDEHEDIKAHLGDKVFEKETLRVYKLK